MNNNAQINTIFEKVKKSICEVSIGNKVLGQGFFASLPINANDRYLEGLIISNHFLSANELKIGNTLNLNFKEVHIVHAFQISEGTFMFTCEFLDITFVEINIKYLKEVKYLRINEEPMLIQNILVCQRDKNDNLTFIEGKTTGFFGTNILFNVKSPYENNTICTPIISLSSDCFGDVIAIKQNNSLSGENNNSYSGLNINILFRAIKTLVHPYKLNPIETLSKAKKLSLTELNVLKKQGLKETENPNIFISPGSQGITPLWFYRTQYAWYWTPTETKNFFEKSEIEKCNWSLIQGNFPIKAIGGMYNNAAPATRNITLIKGLIISGLRFLMN